MKAKKVTERVYQVGGPAITDSSDCSVYLLDLGDLVLVDTGAGSSVEKIIGNIVGLGLDPSLLATIVLTHCHIDHVGGARELKRRFGAKTRPLSRGETTG